MSVCDHLVAPGSVGLFRAAIIQSAPCQAQLALPDAERISVDYARDAGCGDPATAAQCLRALSADELRKPVWYFRIGEDTLSGPVTGTTVLPIDPMTAFGSDGAAKVPMMIGGNRDEFTFFVALQYCSWASGFPSRSIPRLLSDTFGAHAGAVAAHYPLERYGGSVALAYSSAVTDGVFACVAARMTDELAAANPVYAYEFNDPAPPTPDPLRTLPFRLGASHSLELRYLFDIGGAPPLDPAQQALSDQMIDYWSHFVATGAPDVEGQPAWPTVGNHPGAENRLSLQPDGSRLVTGFDDTHQCKFWAEMNHVIDVPTPDREAFADAASARRRSRKGKGRRSTRSVVSGDPLDGGGGGGNSPKTRSSAPAQPTGVTQVVMSAWTTSAPTRSVTLTGTTTSVPSVMAVKSGCSIRAVARSDVVAFCRYCTFIAFGIQRWLVGTVASMSMPIAISATFARCDRVHRVQMVVDEGCRGVGTVKWSSAGLTTP